MVVTVATVVMLVCLIRYIRERKSEAAIGCFGTCSICSVQVGDLFSGRCLVNDGGERSCATWCLFVGQI